MGKICLSCGRDYLPTRNGQKYCLVCGPIIRKAYVATWKKTNSKKVNMENKAWRDANPERSRAYGARWRRLNPEKKKAGSLAWKRANPERAKADRINWAIANPEKAKAIRKRKDHKYYKGHIERVTVQSAKWKAANPDKVKETAKRGKAKRRTLGFIPLNAQFAGCEGHHVDSEYVINMPKALHRSIYHNQHTGQGMVEMNALAYEWLARVDIV